MEGAGHSDYCAIRYTREGLTTAENEKKGKRFVVYFGRVYLTDHRTGQMVAGPMKVGQSTLPNALQRGRNQAGCDFRYLAEVSFDDAESARTAEKIAQRLLMDLEINGPQNQTELYDIRDDDLEQWVRKLIRACTTDLEVPLPLKDALLFPGKSDFIEL